MSYNKPQVGLLGSPIKAVEGQPGVAPIDKHSPFYGDGWPYEIYYLSLTIGAYEADE